MADKPNPPAVRQIKQLLRLHQGGKRHIARPLGISRNTVKTYLDKIATAGLEIDNLLAVDDRVLCQQLHAGNPQPDLQRSAVYLCCRPALPFYPRPGQNGRNPETALGRIPPTHSPHRSPGRQTVYLLCRTDPPITDRQTDQIT